MSDTIVSPTLIVLPGAVWRSELEAELVRLGIDSELAPISAGQVLGSICRRAGYEGAFLIAEEEGDLPVPVDPKKRSRAASRRRWAEAAR